MPQTFICGWDAYEKMCAASLEMIDPYINNHDTER